MKFPYSLCSVLRNASGGDCTNSGQSSHFADLTIIAEITENERFKPEAKQIVFNAPEKLRDDTKEKRAIVVRRILYGKRCDYILPVNAFLIGEWTMAGGNFLWSCDSRFRDDISELPLPIHDRIER